MRRGPTPFHVLGTSPASDDDEDVTAINKQIQSLAPALNSPIGKGVLTVMPIDILVKRHGGATYIFAVNMRDAPAKGKFAVNGIGESAQAEVIGGDRKIQVIGGKFEDDFQGYEVKLFKIH